MALDPVLDHNQTNKTNKLWVQILNWCKFKIIRIKILFSINMEMKIIIQIQGSLVIKIKDHNRLINKDQGIESNKNKDLKLQNQKSLLDHHQTEAINQKDSTQNPNF